MKKKFSENILFSFIREAYGELKRVVWPTRKEIISKTIIVVVSMIIIAAVIGAIDYGLSQGVSVLINLKNKYNKWIIKKKTIK